MGEPGSRVLVGGHGVFGPYQWLDWFGRLGAGDVLARCVTGQADRALELLDRYAEVAVEHGTCPECVDMQVEEQGQGAYTLL